MKKQNILIVDDESINISMLVEILSEKYNLLVATDGLMALEVIDSGEPIDLILLDIVMPKMDGYEVAYRLKHDKNRSDIPFIFLTAKSDAQNIAKGFKAGAVDYISKPFAKEELLARVHNHLKLHSVQNALTDALERLQSNVTQINAANILLDSVINSTNDLIFYKDKELRYIGCNEAFLKFVGKSKKELVGHDDFELFDKDMASLFREMDNKTLQSDKANTNEELVTYPDGSKFYLQTQKIPFKYNESDKGILGVSRDITDKKIAQDKINDYVRLIDKNIITSTIDLEGNITDSSDAFCQISGYSKDELLGKNYISINYHEDNQKDYEQMSKSIEEDKIWSGIVRNRAKEGSYYWIDMIIYPLFDYSSKKIGYTIIGKDITDKKRVEELSITDELTTLYNRRYFNEVFEKELNRAKRENMALSFLMLDIDYFKAYNDTYGHQEGDYVLSKIGDVIKTFSKRANDFAFRLGGEEFGIIFYEKEKSLALNFADSLRNAIESLNIPHANNLVSDVVTVSIGVIFRDDLENVTTSELYKDADDSLYEAKKSGRNRVVIG